VLKHGQRLRQSVAALADCGHSARMSVVALLVLLAAAAPSSSTTPLVPFALESDADVVRALHAHYTKHEAKIPMRDGVKLHTHIWVPKPTTTTSPQTWPMLLVRTPYSVAPYGDNVLDDSNHRALTRFAPSFDLIKSGYIFVHQDVRGALMSEGSFVDVRPHRAGSVTIDESTDAYDTIDWLVKHVAGNNGRVGMWGISYPGFYAAQGAVEAHPALKAVSPQAPVTDWFLGDDFHHNGALCLADAFSFYANFGRARPKPTTTMKWDFAAPIKDTWDFFADMGPIKNANERYLHGEIAFWNDLLAHPNRDAFWQARDPLPHYKNIGPAVLVVGGWFDAEDLWGALATYRAMETQTKNNDVHLVMGPWSHGGWARTDGENLGDLEFGAKTAKDYRSQVEAPFFEHHLKGAASTSLPEALTFRTGSNEWHRFDAWPPKNTQAQTLFLGDRGSLTSTAGPAGIDRFVADPRHPVPFMEGAHDEVDRTYMTADQRFASRRPDVLTYSGAVLTQELVVAGPVDVDFFVETTGGDLDVVVKLIDVLPEETLNTKQTAPTSMLSGAQRLVRAEVFRGRFRKSFEKPEAFAPGVVENVHFTLPDLHHAFRPGHRVMVQVQASWFPLIDSNPQRFVDIGKATDADFVVATHGVHRGGVKASKLTLRTLPSTVH
jgi:putative CocE/NonD family hydrolase